MRTLRFVLFLMLTLAFAWAHARVLTIPFSIKTSDSAAFITGVLEMPTACEQRKCPTVLMVGGTGLFDRDYDFGNSNTNDDLLFRKLATAINKENMIAIRYDYRGVKCSMKTAPKCDSCKSPAEVYKFYYAHCVGAQVRAKVTPHTIREDIATVYNFAFTQESVDSNHFVILAHSEGTVHTAKLVAEKRISPSAMIMLGMVAESPKDMIHWQSVDRNVDSVFKYDTNHNGLIETGERTQFCSANEVMSQNCNELLPLTAKLDRASVSLIMEQLYGRAVAPVLAMPDTAAFPSSEMPMASFAWWKMFYTETGRPIDDLSGYEGKVSFNNGDIDTQTPGLRQIPIVLENISRFKNRPRTHLLPGTGHGFGTHGTYGPMTDQNLQHILEEIKWSVREGAL